MQYNTCKADSRITNGLIHIKRTRLSIKTFCRVVPFLCTQLVRKFIDKFGNTCIFKFYFLWLYSTVIIHLHFIQIRKKMAFNYNTTIMLPLFYLYTPNPFWFCRPTIFSKDKLEINNIFSWLSPPPKLENAILEEKKKKSYQIFFSLIITIYHEK